MLRFSAIYSTQLQALLEKLDVSPISTPKPKSKKFVPDFHIVGSISQDEIIGGIIWSETNVDGSPDGFSFDHEGKKIKIKGDVWQEIKKISSAILRSPDYKDKVSQETLCRLIIDWIKNQYKGLSSDTPAEYLSQHCESQIKEYEVWIPIAETFIEGELIFGNVTIKEISRAMIDRWEDEMVEKLAETRPDLTEESLREYATQFRRKYQGHAAATISITAESVRAYEIAQRQAEQSISLLRCLCFFNADPNMTLYSLPMGQENIPGYKRFTVENGLISLVSEGNNPSPVREFKLDKYHINQLREFGLDTLHQLLTVTKRTAFEEDVLSALLLYSRSSIQQSPGDKLTYILAPIQSLLMDKIDPQEMGERLAMLNERNLLARKAIVKNTIDIYRLRPKFIREEADDDELEILRKFMTTAWVFFINIITLSPKFKTRQEFIDEIEDWKLSGGLE